MKLYELSVILSEEEVKELRGLEYSRGLEFGGDCGILKILSEAITSVDKIQFSNKTIVFDLDGTITEQVESLSHIGEVKSGFPIVFQTLNKMGIRVGVHTARPFDQHSWILDYLEKRSLKFAFINVDPQGIFDSSKPLADVYVDDRSYRFLGDWDREYVRFFNFLNAIY